MALSRKRALAYAEKVLATPRAHLSVTLRQGKGGVTLLHRGRALTVCPLSRNGMQAAVFVARALGVPVPPLGQKVQAEVSTGVLWRAIAISCLDFRKPSSYILLERLLEEAETLRGTTSAEM
ncbi:MAG: hypothetical protein NZ951_06025 [Dehalococcoidia bacterium]|nr:hypothetical protein [Dehalococcoidia bacterium]MDW8119948.1 hypothetical protein [Chloroflexota bacterium]